VRLVFNFQFAFDGDAFVERHCPASFLREIPQHSLVRFATREVAAVSVLATKQVSPFLDGAAPRREDDARSKSVDGAFVFSRPSYV
jgi:hypothetical protein